MKFRNRLSIAFTTLFFIVAGRISVAEDLNGMWAGYYTHYGQKYHMLMFIHHPGMQADDNVSGMMIDARPTTGALDAISARLEDASFKEASFSFTKSYSQEAEDLGYSGKVDYRLTMTSHSEMKGNWQTNQFSGDVFFKRITPETIAPEPPKAAEKAEEMTSFPKEEIAETVTDESRSDTIVAATETVSQKPAKKPEEVISLPKEEVVEVITKGNQDDIIVPSTPKALGLAP